jgi:hypothetical protein
MCRIAILNAGRIPARTVFPASGAAKNAAAFAERKLCRGGEKRPARRIHNNCNKMIFYKKHQPVNIYRLMLLFVVNCSSGI